MILTLDKSESFWNKLYIIISAIICNYNNYWSSSFADTWAQSHVTMYKPSRFVRCRWARRWNINSGFRAQKPCQQFGVFGHGLAGKARRLQKWSLRNTSRIQVCWLKTQPQQQQQQQPQPQQQRKQNLPASISLCNPLTQLTQHNTTHMTTTSSNSNSGVRKLDITVLMLRKWPMNDCSNLIQSIRNPKKDAVYPCRPHLILQSLQSHWIKERLGRHQGHLKNDEVARSLSNGHWLRFKGCCFWEAFPKSVLQAFEWFSHGIVFV